MSSTSAPHASGFVFLSEFAGKGYKRPANRGSKNLRCFPHCRANGHVKSGFCGAPLAFQLHSLPSAAHGNVERVLTWGEFASVLAPSRFRPGDIVTEDALESEERSVEKPLNALFRGDLDEFGESDRPSCTPSSPRFQFNLQMAPYHCGWTPQTPSVEGDLPCFIAHVFLQGVDSNGQVTLQCQFSCRSQPFKILGRVTKAKASKPKLKVEAAATAVALAVSTLTALKVEPAVSSTQVHFVKQEKKYARFDPSGSRKSGGSSSSSSRKRSAASIPEKTETTIHDSVGVETLEEQADHYWLQQSQPAQGQQTSSHTNQQRVNDAWTEIQTPPPQELNDESSFAESYMRDGKYSPSSYYLPDTPLISSPFPDWDNTGDTTEFMGCDQHHNANENTCRQFELPAAARVAMDDAKTSRNPELASKRRRGAAVASSARWWIRTVGTRMRSISAGVNSAIQSDPLVDAEIKESASLYPGLVRFIVQHFAQEAHTKHQTERKGTSKSSIPGGGSGGDGGMGDSEGMEGISGLFAESELAAMFSSDIGMFGSDVAIFGSDVAMFGSDTASLMMDDTLWDLIDEGIDESRAASPVSGGNKNQTVETNNRDNMAADPSTSTINSGENDSTISPSTTFLRLVAPSNNQAFEELSLFLLGDGLTRMIDQAISDIGNEFNVPDIIVAMRSIFANDLNTWTDEREKLIHSLLSFLGRHVTAVLNRELRARGVSHKDVIQLASQLQMQSNCNMAELIPVMTNFAQRVIGEYIKDPMPHPPVPVASHLNLTGKWERSASVEAGFTQEQLKLTAAMNAISLDGDCETQQHASPQVTTSISQQYNLVHQQHALKMQGKRWMIVVHEAVILLDGVARSAIEDGGLDDNLKFSISPRFRGWHTSDGSAIVVFSMPINPETDVDDNDKEAVGPPHFVNRFKRTGLNTLAVTTMLIRHHDTPLFVKEISRIYTQPSGIVDTLALSAMPGCSLLTSITEKYSRVLE